MTPEKQRIAIAEKLGFTNIRLIDGISLVYGPEWPDCRLVPDYPNDLNAMHEAEKALFEEGLALSVMSPELRRELYFSQLIKVCGDRPAMSATAAQRAEAFLKTLGLWED